MPSVKIRFAAVSLLLGLVAACAAELPHSHAEAQDALEERLLAPCCWRQPLADHDSPIAGELRAEIATRLAAGELPAAIEAGLVARYSERIRALPPDGVPRWIIGALLVAALAATSIGIVYYLRAVRRRRETTNRACSRERTPGDERYEEQLDDELLGA